MIIFDGDNIKSSSMLDGWFKRKRQESRDTSIPELDELQHDPGTYIYDTEKDTLQPTTGGYRYKKNGYDGCKVKHLHACIRRW